MVVEEDTTKAETEDEDEDEDEEEAWWWWKDTYSEYGVGTHFLLLKNYPVSSCSLLCAATRFLNGVIFKIITIRVPVEIISSIFADVDAVIVTFIVNRNNNW